MRNAEVIRQWQILREIESRRAGVTIHELSRHVKVTTRTIRRDLQALQESGFAIYDEGGEHETKRWRLDAQPFRAVQDGLSVADVAALYLSRSVVDGVSGWPLSDELRAAFDKIERSLNPRMREFLATLPQVISAKAGPGGGARTTRVVDVTRRLLHATRERREIEMRYFSASSNRAKAYRMQPYRLALAPSGMYLIAWVPAYEAFRTFALERVEKLSVSEETFRRTRELPDDPFAFSMGVFTGKPETVALEFEPRMTPYVRGRIWHPSQRVEELGSGGVRLTLEVSIDPALRTWILGFGAAVRVVRPAALSRAIADELRQALANIESAE
jgi:predicted DNA-binding transcriptional regulator YafY